MWFVSCPDSCLDCTDLFCRLSDNVLLECCNLLEPFILCFRILHHVVIELELLLAPELLRALDCIGIHLVLCVINSAFDDSAFAVCDYDCTYCVIRSLFVCVVVAVDNAHAELVFALCLEGCRLCLCCRNSCTFLSLYWFGFLDSFRCRRGSCSCSCGGSCSCRLGTRCAACTGSTLTRAGYNCKDETECHKNSQCFSHIFSLCRAVFQP